MLTFLHSIFSLRLFLRCTLFISLFILTAHASMCQAFVTRWSTDGPGGSGPNQIIIPATGTYHIDWKEVSVPTNTGSLNATGQTTVTFPHPGVYEVSITGGITSIKFNNETAKDRLKIISLEQWGNVAWTNMDFAFTGCSGLSLNATDVPNLSAVTSMESMFYDCPFVNAPIGNWNVSNVTNMRFLFGGTQFFNQDLSAWDVSNVTDMEGMFYYATAFNGNISNWNVSKVTSMRYMFQSTPFNQNISAWNVSNVTNKVHMFGS